MSFRCYFLILFVVCLCTDNIAQVKVTIPSSIPLTVDFGTGTINPGPPLSTGFTDFNYSPYKCPSTGGYTITNKDECFNLVKNDAGNRFFGNHPLVNDSGYMMLVSYEVSPVSKVVFGDTIKNLCSGNQYLFWAAINNLITSSCFQTNLSFNIETISGAIIQTFQTGDIGGTDDNHHPYFGFGGYDGKASSQIFMAVSLHFRRVLIIS